MSDATFQNQASDATFNLYFQTDDGILLDLSTWGTVMKSFKDAIYRQITNQFSHIDEFKKGRIIKNSLDSSLLLGCSSTLKRMQGLAYLDSLNKDTHTLMNDSNEQNSNVVFMSGRNLNSHGELTQQIKDESECLNSGIEGLSLCESKPKVQPPRESAQNILMDGGPCDLTPVSGMSCGMDGHLPSYLEVTPVEEPGSTSTPTNTGPPDSAASILQSTSSVTHTLDSGPTSTILAMPNSCSQSTLPQMTNSKTPEQNLVPLDGVSSLTEGSRHATLNSLSLNPLQCPVPGFQFSSSTTANIPYSGPRMPLVQISNCGAPSRNSNIRAPMIQFTSPMLRPPVVPLHQFNSSSMLTAYAGGIPRAPMLEFSSLEHFASTMISDSPVLLTPISTPTINSSNTTPSVQANNTTNPVSILGTSVVPKTSKLEIRKQTPNTLPKTSPRRKVVNRDLRIRIFYRKRLKKITSKKAAQSRKCDRCVRVFDCCDELNQHMRTIHGSWKCKKCLVILPGSVQLEEHYNKEHGKPPDSTECDVCGLEKRFRCSRCECRLHTQAELDNHVRDKHTSQQGVQSEQPEQGVLSDLECGLCRLKFASKSHLSNHSRRFHQELKCRYCKQVLIGTIALEKHFIKHNHIAVAKCPICSRSFYQRRQLKNHIKLCHYQYKCYECYTSFNTPYMLRSHLKSKHSSITSKSTMMILDILSKGA